MVSALVAMMQEHHSSATCVRRSRAPVCVNLPEKYSIVSAVGVLLDSAVSAVHWMRGAAPGMVRLVSGCARVFQ
jgi:hypothetical protein